MVRRFAGALATTLLLLVACGGDSESEVPAATPDTTETPGRTGDRGDDDDDDLDGGASEPPFAEPPDEPPFEEEPDDDGGADGGTACKRKIYTLRHLQASMEHFDPPAERNASIDKAFAAGAHTISWTEVETLGQVQHIQARKGWDTFWPSGKPEVASKNSSTRARRR